MTGKMKALLMLGLIMLAVASTLYVAPALAQMNGDPDQTQDRIGQKDRSCSCDCACGSCSCDCDCGCDCTQTQLRTRACPDK